MFFVAMQLHSVLCWVTHHPIVLMRSECSSTWTFLFIYQIMSHDVVETTGIVILVKKITVRDLSGQGGAIDPRQPSPPSPRRGHP